MEEIMKEIIKEIMKETEKESMEEIIKGLSLVSSISKTQGSLSTSTAESEIKAVNQCLKEEALALRGMLNLMGFPQDATIIEEDSQACVYASEIPHMTRGMRHLDLAFIVILIKSRS